MPKCETVKVQSDNEQGFTVINECDLKEGDVIFGQEEQPVAEVAEVAEEESTKPAAKKPGKTKKG